jgi:hypothetical protein
VQIKIETTLLADDLLTGAPHSGLLQNGQQIIDEVQFFQAASPRYFARGGAGVALQFSTTRQFDTIRAAEAFVLLHFGSLPLSGLITAITGIGTDTQTCYLRNAVIESANVTGYKGTSVTIQYSIKGGLWESDVPPEVPGDPDTGEETIVMRRGSVSIASAATSVDVTFSSPLSGVPTVIATISRPEGGDAIWPIIQSDSITINGFTADLSGATPDADYKLNYAAIE